MLVTMRLVVSGKTIRAMTITVDWIKKDKSLRVDFGADWNEPEYFQAVEKANAMVKKAGQSVNVILNMGTSVGPGNTFGRGKKTIMLMPENIDNIIIVSTSEFAKAMMGTLFKIYNRADVHVEMLETMDEAIKRYG